MTITATEVKKLRDATGAGMMDAKKALTEAEGDFERAIELLRVTGLAKAAKRSDREASNGLVAASGHALVQLGAETDFVAKNQEFMALAQSIADAVDGAKAEGKVLAGAVTLGDSTVADQVAALSAKIGEKLELKEAAYFDGQVSSYLHRRSSDLPPQVGVLVEYEGDDAEFVHSICLQIAAMSPRYVSREEVPADVVATETRIAEETAREEGKPEAALPRIIE
ncbi:MAG TPA: translation elongation factor Ts, partial [Propionibacteriaceae bacterium]|nr:translation elongation factor Ts [Propionibacteriaceae bacterium]